MPTRRIRIPATTRHTMHGLVHVRGYTKEVHTVGHPVKRRMHHRRRMI